MKRMFVWLTKRWTLREAAITLAITIAAAYSVSGLRDLPFGLPAVVVMLIFQGWMWYSTGRVHQHQDDQQVLDTAQTISLETRRLLLEAYLFEMWWVDMRHDPEHAQILISTRISRN